jgi:hypothetical protein
LYEAPNADPSELYSLPAELHGVVKRPEDGLETLVGNGFEIYHEGREGE